MSTGFLKNRPSRACNSNLMLQENNLTIIVLSTHGYIQQLCGVCIHILQLLSICLYFMDQKEETVSRIDNINRVLSHLDSTDNESNSEETLKLKNEIDKEDRLKLANLFEDMVILLRDDPDNKSKIKELWNRVMNGYGHIGPISEILQSVKKYFL